jgi:serine/threonine protein kinase
MRNDCPADAAIVAFAHGQLRGEALAVAELHLDGCERCRVAFGEAARTRSRPSPSPSPLEPTLFRPGDLLANRYRITRFIARGGMGEVYEAEDTRLCAAIALKSVAAALSDNAKTTARLQAEVQLARRITHTNVCKVYDVDVDDGTVFLTMELLDGETLGGQVRRGGRLHPALVESMLRQMVAGLSAAHDAGVVHRDFKSDNVMVCPSPGGREPRVVVMDFGLARALRAEPGVPRISTTTGAIVGSVAYLAPEQVSGNHPATPATDVYALGVVLFELLTGALPFRGKTPIETAVLRLTTDPPSPSRLVPGLAPSWDRLVARCLAVAPEARFASMAEVSHAMRRSY